MKQVLFIHSAGPQGPTDGSGPFLAALRKGLGPEVSVLAPLMPSPEAPDPATWGAAIAGHIAAMEGCFVLVGHSLGGSMLLNDLAVRVAPKGLAGVVIVAAPYWGLADWDADGFKLPEGFAARLGVLPALVFYQSRDDDVVELSHAEAYSRALPAAKLRLVDGRGHSFANVPVDDIVADIAALLG